MSLNIQQQKVVDSNSSRILCLAGAGTGKTYTMLSRIGRIVGEGVNPYNILVLTFTNAAAFEMEDRYRRDNPRRLIPSFNTFHAFCYQLIINDEKVRTAIGYTQIPSIPDEEKIKYIETLVIQKLGIKLSIEKLEGKKALSIKEQWEYELYWKEMRKTLKKENVITFDIMCYEVCELFYNNEELIQEYKERYKYIFVDEFQDTDPKQWKFVSSFDKSNIMVVGDVFQAIYAFRGADSSIIKSLAENKDWETIRLIHNYRSTKEICNFANEINIDASDIYRLNLVSDRDGDGVEVLNSPSMISSNPYLVEVLTKICSNIQHSTAILARANSEVYTIKEVLKNMNIPFNSKDSSKEIVNILNCILNDEYAVGWLASKLTADKYADYLKLCAIEPEHKTFQNFCKLYYNCYGIYDIINTIMDIRSIISKNEPNYRKGFYILESLGITDKILDLTEDMTLSDIVSYLIDIVSITENTNLYVGTIHSVKGLEYDEVHVMGVNGKSFPITSEECYNLYYVACTRAKDKLFVYKRDV